MKDKTRGLLINIGLFFVALIIVMGMAELALRLTMPRFAEQSLTQYREDSDVGYTYKQNIDMMIQPSQAEKPYNLKTNSLGYREKEIGPKDENTIRIIGLGDSFTFGVDVEKRETFLGVLEQELNSKTGKKFETLNFGVSAYGTQNEVAVLKKFGPRVKPDIALLAFYTGNDFYDNATKSLAVASEGGNASCGSFFSCTYGFMKTNSYLFAFADYQIGKIPALKKMFFDMGLAKHFLPQELMMMKENGMPEEKTAIEKTTKYLSEFKAEAKKQGAKPIIVIIPVATQIDYNLLEQFAQAYLSKPGEFDAQRPTRILKEIAAEQGIETIDLTPVLLEKNLSEKMYLPGAGHFTIAGNKEAGTAIASYLENTFQSQPK